MDTVIEPCRLKHLREIARNMRPEDRAEFQCAGLDPRHRLVALYRMSPQPKAAMVDGRVAAVWGDAAPLLAPEGLMWLVTGPAVECLSPLAFFRAARREVRNYLKTRRCLRSCIAGAYPRAVRFFALIGFAIDPPVLIGGNEYRLIRIARDPGNG